MARVDIIVCERTGNWAAGLRRVAPDFSALVSETRSWAECQGAMERSQQPIVAAEATVGNLPHALHYVSTWHRRYPHAVTIVLAARGLETCEDALREAGAAHVMSSPRQISELVSIIERHLDRWRAPQSLADEVWESLPWPS